METCDWWKRTLFVNDCSSAFAAVVSCRASRDAPKRTVTVTVPMPLIALARRNCVAWSGVVARGGGPRLTPKQKWLRPFCGLWYGETDRRRANGLLAARLPTSPAWLAYDTCIRVGPFEDPLHA
ncbi:hypothetical protein PHYPSEUDO_010775 [Phytophthora pseudosyringae]|uniref:Uncharacterized protein n=1 Tax=Phytophthora pseudosyringae TaxID=221518 RepID=A0A8T1W6W6_9STRA|nr:hypothetical protein PHYPSEUDO_010775 [Phytophthora pseudosyringae]